MNTSADITVNHLAMRASKARDWMMNAMFPLWAKQGLTPFGLFADRLTLEHRYMPTKSTRTRLQARQTYVFTIAAEMGWQTDRAGCLVNQGVRTLSNNARCSRGASTHLLCMEKAAPINDDSNLYDTAFTLFAFAHAHRVTGQSIDPAYEILEVLDQRFRDHENGGYIEAFPRPEYRDQNPHMHMLEACHALYEADGDSAHLKRADEIVRLFEVYMTDHPTGTLCEHFALDWSPLETDNDDIIEPGHQLEWVWLLGRHSALCGLPEPSSLYQVYDTACTMLDSVGRVFQRVRRNGTAIDASVRTWQQTDALKAHLTLFELTGDAVYANLAIRSFDLLMDDFLTPEGGWNDHLDQNGKPISQNMTAATGYHVVLAFRELMRVTHTS